MKKVRIIIVFTLFSISLLAQNPIVQAGMYIADPSAHQWKDGKIYIYGSRDERPDYYCSWSYNVLSSSDMKTWAVTENTFASKGNEDQVPYSDNILYAPDCQYRNGKYYLYYCLATNINTGGVAASASPTGPFVNGQIMDLKGINEIDPAVFIDDDGQAYYIWGQMNAKIAKLKPNMIEIDSTTIKQDLVTEKDHFFHEGAYMVKRNKIYYMVYADISRAGRPTCLGYATSKSPMGPFKYRGVIIDNDHSDPGCWNNHGSIARFNGKWYVFYHRSTHGSNSMRKICIEPIEFNKDGSISEVEMTTQGAGDPLKAELPIDAERACLLYGNVRIKAISDSNEALVDIRNGDAAGYKYVDFNGLADSIQIEVFPGKKGVTIEVAIGHAWSPSIGRINIPDNGDGKTKQIISAPINKVDGVHAVWLRFWGDSDEFFKVDSFKFIQK